MWIKWWVSIRFRITVIIFLKRLKFFNKFLILVYNIILWLKKWWSNFVWLLFSISQTYLRLMFILQCLLIIITTAATFFLKDILSSIVISYINFASLSFFLNFTKVLFLNVFLKILCISIFLYILFFRWLLTVWILTRNTVRIWIERINLRQLLCLFY